MRLHRFYTTENLEGRAEIKIFDEKLLHQLRDVFRLTAGSEIIFFDGRGTDYKFSVNILSKKEGVFEKISEEDVYVPEKKVTLLMSVIKKENFELAVEKATEIGVTKIVPVLSERTLQKNLNTERLQRIMIEASEQCGRGDIPDLGETVDLETALQEYLDIIAFDITGGNLETLSKDISSPKILIGPEGGWSEKELELLKEKNISIAKLGDTTLRAETAAIVASAKVLGL